MNSDGNEAGGAPTQQTRDLLARYLGGDEEAGFRLFRAHADYIANRARRLLRGSPLRGAIDIDDLVNESFARALASGLLERMHSERRGALRAALKQVLRRVILDRNRRDDAEKRRLPPGAGLLTPDDAEAARDSAAISPTSHAREAELLEQCRAMLTPEQWDVWYLSAVDGLEAAEIAVRLGTTASAVRGVLFRARKRMARHLGAAETWRHG